MSRHPYGGRLPRRQLLRVAAASAGTVAVGGAVLSGADEDCDGVDYEHVRVKPAAVSGPVDGESYCSVEQRVADRLGVDAGDQLRLGARGPDPDADLPEKLFTVATVYRRGPKAVRATEADLTALGFDGPGEGAASATVPHPCYDTEAAAKEHGEFVETRFRGSGDDPSLVLLAPHGDYVELGTGDQAAYAADRFELPAWICYGANPGGGSYERWHVASTELSYGSFPALRRVAEEEHDAALAFHGRSFDESDGEPYVGVGGRATDLKDAVVAALRAAYEERNVSTPVCAVGAADDCEHTGTDRDNVVNRVTGSGDGGVQLEQPYSIRDDHGRLTARVAVEAILAALRSSESVQAETSSRCPCGE